MTFYIIWTSVLFPFLFALCLSFSNIASFTNVLGNVRHHFISNFIVFWDFFWQKRHFHYRFFGPKTYYYQSFVGTPSVNLFTQGLEGPPRCNLSDTFFHKAPKCPPLASHQTLFKLKGPKNPLHELEKIAFIF